VLQDSANVAWESCVGLVAFMSEVGNPYLILVGKHQGKRPIRITMIRKSMLLKWTLPWS